MATKGSKIYIQVGYGTPSAGSAFSVGGVASASSSSKSKAKGKAKGIKDKEGKFSRFVTMKALREALGVGLQYADQYIGNIGNMSGLYQSEANAKFALSMAQKYGGAAITVGIDIATGNYAAAAVVAISTAVDFFVSNHIAQMNNEIAMNNSRINSDAMRRRAGLDGATDNGRGTEN